MKKIIFILFILLGILVYSTEIPNLSGPIIDLAGMISPDDNSTLSNAISSFYSKTSIQFQILTINSLENESIEGFSIRVADKWKIGSKENKGVILITSKEDRKIRIEVGRGLEGDITDAFSGRIIRQLMIPRFKEGEFALGFALALTTIANKLQLEFPLNTGIKKRRIGNILNHNHIFFIIFIIIFIFNFFKSIFFRRRRGLIGFFDGFGGGFGGGGFFGGGSGGGWSGGGGSFSGGGASGSW